ncbi:MAG: antitoxin Xre/MbcA/ParS toxin-binding domain-containing protein [Gammaproteobacteria bacterium]
MSVKHTASKQPAKARVLRKPHSGAHLVAIPSLTADQVRKGLPMSVLIDLATQLNVERGTLLQVLGTSLRTLQRKAEGRERLGAAASDRLARVARILNLASHVFGETPRASGWLTSKSRALGGEIPLYMLDTDIGAERVQQELRQIEFGMPF